MPLNTFSRSLHQFSVGRTVYLRGHTDPFTVTAHYHRRGWPHYELADVVGDQWIASQLELSSKPFVASGRLSR